MCVRLFAGVRRKPTLIDSRVSLEVDAQEILSLSLVSLLIAVMQYNAFILPNGYSCTEV